MIGPSKRIWLLLFSLSVMLVFGYADAQPPPQPSAQAGAPGPQGAPNPYLMGSEGYGKGPRGLTSFQPIAIDQPFAARMAQEAAARPGITREHQALLEERYDLVGSEIWRRSRNRETSETQGREVWISSLENTLRGRFDDSPIGNRVAAFDKIRREPPHNEGFLLGGIPYPQIDKRANRRHGNGRT